MKAGWTMAGKANGMRDGIIFKEEGELKHVILMQKPDNCEEWRGMAEEQQKQSGGSERVVTGQVEGRRRREICLSQEQERAAEGQQSRWLGKATFIFPVPS